ncbi:MAG: hypothetical protein JXR41_01615 [Bacteroidales bacterium]|nr:hypothetical protein [Bacteroidales bacterium]MBN2761757.1 hypothetical protein [Bacteroidales bacterium]
MKKQKFLKQTFTAFLAAIGLVIFAQEDIILDPAALIPADTGYYIGGVYKDKDQDGTDEFYNGCVDEYGDASHNESGVQQGFTYNLCMIMPTCWPKDAVDDHDLAEIEHAEGYIELTKSKYPGTDSAQLGYIISPPLQNLVSLYLETSPDVSSNDSRHIYFWVEYSKDYGATWEMSYIQDETISKAGDSRTYDGSVYLEFEEMKTASTEGPIVIRIMSTPQESPPGPQRVKIHYLKIVADKASAIQPVTIDCPEIKILNNTIYNEDNTIEVYNMLGQFIGRGRSVQVPDGIYIVKTPEGSTQKVFVE